LIRITNGHELSALWSGIIQGLDYYIRRAGHAGSVKCGP
jgi:hypothetical protein